ncbi:MAG: hypothetical protein AVDCRST_MAG59-463, partial [uncultured Thermomicrobiales bacterium]
DLGAAGRRPSRRHRGAAQGAGDGAGYRRHRRGARRLRRSGAGADAETGRHPPRPPDARRQRRPGGPPLARRRGGRDRTGGDHPHLLRRPGLRPPGAGSGRRRLPAEVDAAGGADRGDPRGRPGPPSAQPGAARRGAPGVRRPGPGADPPHGRPLARGPRDPPPGQPGRDQPGDRGGHRPHRGRGQEAAPDHLRQAWSGRPRSRRRRGDPPGADL